MRRTPGRTVGVALAAASLLVATACSGDEAEPEAAPTSAATSSGDQVLEDFCTAAGLVRFMETGEDLNLWAEDLGARTRPADLPADAAAGLDLLVEYAASVPADAVAEDLEQPAYTDEEVAQLQAYSAYLESCPQVTDPPTPSTTATP
ncbi:hypothetical protein RDV89_09000 [Nocardioides zeae]|uniref:DUF732 domain-containing protein n=1 Tax=Nocardioides imazamoxiresistens TaxID=3231893 RepID=A0ABU3PVJ6_9ACTN|nr:hypothetical protein [Nocardioides zeae]MDT9593204.1 hypothetical protein [Nocardioides zeae]